MARPVIALLTDFGTRDHYAGTMKGVALGICPDVTFVDITHDVPAHDVLTAALELEAAYKYFPASTVFLVVVDPGVGSARRAIAAAAHGYAFVAPDNGVLTAVFAGREPERAVELTDRRYQRPTVSRTFEGRDRFAPAAAWIANGTDLADLGPPAGALHRLAIPEPRVSPDEIRGEVLRIDRFGNLITNVDRRAFEPFARNATVEIRIGPHTVTRVVSAYAEVEAAAICALFGSGDRLEVAANGASAADALRIDRGAPVHITRRA